MGFILYAMLYLISCYKTYKCFMSFAIILIILGGMDLVWGPHQLGSGSTQGSINEGCP